MQGCGLRKVLRSPKVLNHEILGAQQAYWKKYEFFQSPKSLSWAACGTYLLCNQLSYNIDQNLFSSRDLSTKANLLVVRIDRFRYITIQPKTIDLSIRLWGISIEFVGFIPQSLVLRSIVLG